MADDTWLFAVAWLFVLLGLVIGYYTDPIPCASPAQTGCGYDAGHVAFVMFFPLAALTIKRFLFNQNSESTP